MSRQEFGDRLGIGAVTLHPHMQRLDAGDGQERVHRRHGWAVVAQRHRPRLGGEGEIAEILVEAQAVIRRLRFCHGRELAAARPVELAGLDHNAAHGIAVAAEELGGRVGHDVSAPLERPAQIRRGQGVVDDQRQAGGMRDIGDRRNVDDDAARDWPGSRRRSPCSAASSARRKFSGSAGSTKWQFQPSFLNDRPNWVSDPPYRLPTGEELIPRLQHGGENQELRGMAGSGGNGGAAAFQAGDPFLQHRHGRVGQPGVDIAEIMQVEQRRSVIDVVEHISRGLVDRR